VSEEIDEVRRRIEEVQSLPAGTCARCNSKTGKFAPHYARLEVDVIVIWMPFCQRCVDSYLRMVLEQMPKAPKRSNS
jgi:hypothetical protein